MATSRRSNNVSANEIAAYTGNAAAGLAGTGANANAPDNAPLTQTARDLALASFQGNQILFRQFKDDMDKAYKMLDDDQLIPDEVTEEDRPLIEEKKKKLLEIFNSVNGDLMNNPEAYRKFTATAQDAKSTIKHSQKWYLWRNAELKRRQEMTNPVEQAEFDKAMTGQLSKKQQNFWALPDPYAPITDYKLDIVAAPPVFGAPVQTRQGDEVVTTTAVDPAATFDQYTKLFGQKNNTHQFQRYVTQFLSDPAAMDRVNARLKEKFGDRVAAINPAADRADQIAAKIALADNDAQKQTREFDKDRAANALGYARLREDARQANMQDRRAGEGNALQRRALELKSGTGAQPTAEEQEAQGVWDFIRKRVNIKPDGTAYVLDEDLPAGFRNIAGAIYTNDQKDPKLVAGSITPHTSADKKKIYDIDYTDASTGAKMNLSDLKAMYENDRAGKNPQGQRYSGSFNQYLQTAINSNLLDIELKGKNGRANFRSTLHSSRLISNQAGSGKETPVRVE